jgi:hypothetical protein
MDGWTYRRVRNVDIVPSPDRPGFPHRQQVSVQPAARLASRACCDGELATTTPVVRCRVTCTAAGAANERRRRDPDANRSKRDGFGTSVDDGRGTCKRAWRARATSRRRCADARGTRRSSSPGACRPDLLRARAGRTGRVRRNHRRAGPAPVARRLPRRLQPAGTLATRQRPAIGERFSVALNSTFATPSSTATRSRSRAYVSSAAFG